MRISVIGTGLCRPRLRRVFCRDRPRLHLRRRRSVKVDRINRGETPIHENGLDELLATPRRHAGCRATTDLAQGGA